MSTPCPAKSIIARGQAYVDELGTGLRNMSSALLVSVQNFKDRKVTVMLVIGALTGLLLLLPVAWILGTRTEGSARWKTDR